MNQTKYEIVIPNNIKIVERLFYKIISFLILHIFF